MGGARLNYAYTVAHFIRDIIRLNTLGTLVIKSILRKFAVFVRAV